MLSKQQAETVAAEVVREEAIRHSDRQERWWWLRPMYRFPELGNMPRWEQFRIVNLAAKEADKSPAVWLSGSLGLAAILYVGLLAPAEYSTFPWIFGVVIAFGVTTLLIRRSFVRRSVRELLAKREREGRP
jgi:hypothetical protein